MSYRLPLPGTAARANEQADYDDATTLEALGGKIIELPKSEWKVLSTAQIAKAA